jgi:hypothetical protein
MSVPLSDIGALHSNIGTQYSTVSRCRVRASLAVSVPLSTGVLACARMALRTEGERTRAILPAHRSAHRSAAPAISVVLGLVRFVFCLFAYLLSSVCAGPLCFMKGWTAHYFRLGPSYSRSAGLRPCAPLVRPPAPPTSSSHRHPITLDQNDARTLAHARTHARTLRPRAQARVQVRTLC